MCFSRCSSGNSSSSATSRTLSLEDCLRIGALADRDFFCEVGDNLRTGGLGDKAMSGSVELRSRGRGAIPTDGDVELRNMAGDPRVGAVTPRCSTGEKEWYILRKPFSAAIFWTVQIFFSLVELALVQLCPSH